MRLGNGTGDVQNISMIPYAVGTDPYERPSGLSLRAARRLGLFLARCLTKSPQQLQQNFGIESCISKLARCERPP